MREEPPVRPGVLLLTAWLLAGAAAGPAQDHVAVQAALERPLLAPKQAEQEMQAYCRARAPKMPPVTSAAEWEATAARLREAVLARVVYRGEAARWRDAPLRIDWQETIPGGAGYQLKKLRYEALPGLWIPAILYEPCPLPAGPVPAVLNVNGHDPKGKAAAYKQIRCINLAKRGMLALNVEWLHMGQLRVDGFMHWRMNQIDLCGTSGLAVHYLAMKRGLDVLLSLKQADPSRVAVTGLSGGGWQTITLSALDPRVKLCNPVAGYSSLVNRCLDARDLGDAEQVATDLGTVVDYTHLTAMLAPRPALLTYNAKDDCCFVAATALPPLLEAARPVYRLFGRSEALRWHVNEVPGTHNFERDNREACYRMLGDFFFPGKKDGDPREIPCDQEVKDAKELAVALPAKNEDFNSLALTLAKDLPRGAELPRDKSGAVGWQQNRRATLRALAKVKDYEAIAAPAGEAKAGQWKVAFWKLRIGGEWTVPAVELTDGRPRPTAILLADGGRRAAAAHAVRLLKAGYRVIALDPLYFGETTISHWYYQYSLLISCLGDRLLGIQAGQVAAIARWAGREPRGATVVSVGPRSSVVALVAAAVEEKNVGELELRGSLGSLKELIEQNRYVVEFPELFCFGLLEAMDVRQLAALAAPRPAVFLERSPRVSEELSGLKAWYRLWNSSHDPLP
jgi:dienelactone hydrolase